MAGKKVLVLLGVIFTAAAACGCAYPGNNEPVGPTQVVTAGLSPTPVLQPAMYTGFTPTPPPGEEWYNETYTWEYKGVQWDFHVQISHSIYDFYQDSPHNNTLSYVGYALTDEDKSFMQDITGKFRERGTDNGYSDYDNAMNVLVFVQSIPYTENVQANYTRYPIETLKDGDGDCRDKSILAAAMLHKMGYGVALLQYSAHMAVGIALDGEGTHFDYNGSRYYYAETTGTNWGIGEVPDDLKGQTPTVIPLP